MIESILVTGGTGYIGSHTTVQLLNAGFSVVILDNLSNSNAAVVGRIEKITGKRVDFIEGDIRNPLTVKEVLAKRDFRAVLHFAGHKAVGEAEEFPLKYYSNNVYGSEVLLEEMQHAGVLSIVFSSSATVYGNPGYPKYREDTPLAPENVYGRTKRVVEDMLRDVKKARKDWRIAILRYFNPVGAHESGLMGEAPNGIPNNLMPYIAQVAAGIRPKLSVFGNDYPTPDGTGLRDYIHVEDLAAGHLAALMHIKNNEEILTVNLGTGRPYSVLEMIRAFERASGKRIPYQVTARRAGDLGEYYADPQFAQRVLNWEATLGIDRMCMDTWRWQNL